MDIAALSMGLSNANVMQQANVSMMKKTMDLQQNQMESLISTIQSTPAAPSFGHILNARA